MESYIKKMRIAFYRAATVMWAVLLFNSNTFASQQETVICDSLLILADSYQKQAGTLQIKGEYYEGINLVKRALEIHKAYNDSLNIAKDMQILSDAYFRVGDQKRAEDILKRVLKLKNSIGGTTIFETYLSFVRLYNEQGKHDDAYVYLNLMEQHLERNDNKRNRIYLLNSQSLFYILRDKDSIAEDKLLKAIDLCIDTNDEVMQAICYNNLGRLYLKQYDNVRALLYLEKAYLIEKERGNIDGQLQKSVNISAAYFRLEQYDKLKDLLNDIIPKARGVGNKQVLASGLYNLALTYEIEKSYKLSYDKFMEAVKVSEDINDVQAVYGCYQHLAYVAYKLKNYKKAYSYQVSVNEYKDSIKQDEFRAKIERIEQDKRVLEAELENERINLDLNRERTKLVTSQRNIFVVVLVALVIIITVGLVFRIYIRRQKRVLSEHEDKQQILTREVQNRDSVIDSKVQIIGNLGRKVKYTKSELDQMVFLLNEVQNLIDFVSDSLSNLVKKSRLAKVHQIPVAEELQRFRNLLEQRPSVKYGFKKNDGDVKARIRQRFPDLSKNETEMCLMLKLGFTTREIAAKNNTIHKSVEVARYRMRKRLGFNSVDDFMDELNEV